MRLSWTCVYLSLSLLTLIPVTAHQASAPAATGTTLLQRSLAAQVATNSISDVTFTGTARRIAGSDDESGAVTLKVLSTGATRIDFTFPSGPRSEFKSLSSDGPTGGWSGPDQVVHPMANHNVVADWGWFPAFTVGTSLNQKNTLVALIGQETRDNSTVSHIRVVQQFSGVSASIAALMQHLSQVDIYVDPANSLPAAIAYSIHPDDDAGQDIPVELKFADYRLVNGCQIPFRIQKFLNNSLVFDLQFQSAALNTGITAAQMGAQ